MRVLELVLALLMAAAFIPDFIDFGYGPLPGYEAVGFAVDQLGRFQFDSPMAPLYLLFWVIVLGTLVTLVAACVGRGWRFAALITGSAPWGLFVYALAWSEGQLPLAALKPGAWAMLAVGLLLILASLGLFGRRRRA